MDLWVFMDSGSIPRDSLENPKFMEYIYQEHQKQSADPNQDTTLTLDASQGGVPEQIIEKDLGQCGGGVHIYIYVYLCI